MVATRHLWIWSLSLYIGLFLGYPFTNVQAQVEVPLISNSQLLNQSILSSTQQRGSIDLPFMDDFSYTGVYPSSSLWEDRHVFVNPTMGYLPPSLGVATFDGIDENGRAYGGGFGASDQLTSVPINLTGSTDITLSFWLQPQGYGDRPEEADVMVLEFLDINNEWITIATINGPDGTISKTENPLFEYYNYAVETDFLHANFQFRFTNYGARSGMLDMWHLDYVRLASASSSPTEDDVAFTRLPRPILKRYTSMPWNHFINDVNDSVRDSIYIGMYNHFDGQTAPVQSSTLNVYEKRTNAPILTDITLLNGQQANIESGVSIERQYSLSSESAAVFPSVWEDYLPNIRKLSRGLDTAEIVMTYDIDVASQRSGAGYEAITVNDQASYQTNFYNYFAHDDGVAESAIAAEYFNGESVEIAVKFTTNVPDTLRNIQIMFPRSVVDASDQLINLKVWVGELDDEPEYIATFLRPIYPDVFFDTLQGYTSYPLMDDFTGELTPLALPEGDFYIGWEQLSNCTGSSCTAVGLDRNNPDAGQYNFRNRGTKWEPFPAAVPAGALMIRPVVGKQTLPTTGEEVTTTIEPLENILVIYPNPVSETLYFQEVQHTSLKLKIELYNIAGQLIWSQEGLQPMDCRELQNGLYFMNVYDLNDLSKVYRKKIAITN